MRSAFRQRRGASCDLRREQAMLVAILLAGFALRLVMLDRFPLHQDEAIYGVWARHAMRVDPLFLTVWPDKPPLYLWLLGWTVELLGATPPAARLLNIVFSTLSIAVVASLARHWWGGRAGVFAALLFALSPFAVSFAPTVFTDPLMVLAGLLAVSAALRRRYGWAGLWLGAAVMTKQQGIFFAPLILAFAVHLPFSARSASRAALLFLGGLLLILLPVTYWDSLRWAVAPSPWDLGARNASGFGLSSPDTWAARLREWSVLGVYLLGNWMWMAVALSAAGVSLFLRRRRARAAAWRAAAILAGWSAAFFALHVLTAVQVWDRYLLPLAPMVALLGAYILDRGVTSLVPPLTTPTRFPAGSKFVHAPTASSALTRWRRIAQPQAAPVLAQSLYTAGAGIVMASGAPVDPGTPAVRTSTRPAFSAHAGAVLLAVLGLLAVMTIPAVRAAYGEHPVGGDHGAYTGLDEAVAWVNAQADAAPVIYHRNLGWHLRFYLFDLVQGGQVELRWYASASYLADNAAKTPHRPRYVIVADWSPERTLDLHLASRGMTARARLHDGNITVLELVERSTAPASWRVCREPAASLFLPYTDAGALVRPQACVQEVQP